MLELFGSYMGLVALGLEPQAPHLIVQSSQKEISIV